LTNRADSVRSEDATPQLQSMIAKRRNAAAWATAALAMTVTIAWAAIAPRRNAGIEPTPIPPAAASGAAEASTDPFVPTTGESRTPAPTAADVAASGAGASTARTIADLPPNRIRWIGSNYEAKLSLLLNKINDPGNLGEGGLPYLRLLREVSVTLAQLDLIKNGAVLLTDAPPPSQPGHLKLQEFSFVDNVARTARRETIRDARLVYFIDLTRHPDIAAFDDRIQRHEHILAIEEAHRFNSLDDATRAKRIAEFNVRWQEHMASRQALAQLDQNAPDYLERMQALWQVVQVAMTDCESLVPRSIAVDLRSNLARAVR
jgi:hypothetical protein